jgi:hypothetical protein
MGDFFRSAYGIDNEQGFVQGAGRILMADYDPDPTAFPAGIEDLLVLTPGATQWDPVAPWTEVGFTKTGINITRNNAEEEYDVDQIRGAIRRRPTNWEMSIGTQVAEATLESYGLAWELGSVQAVTKVAPQLNERHIGLNAPTVYKERMVAVVFPFPDGTVRAWVLRRCTRAPQDAGMTLNKTGEQVSLPHRWNCLTVPDAPVDSQFGKIMEQVPAP